MVIAELRSFDRNWKRGREKERESESALHLSVGYPTNEFIAQQ